VTAMSKKRSPGFQEKNRGVTPSVAAPGVTHRSDATAFNADREAMERYGRTSDCHTPTTRLR